MSSTSTGGWFEYLLNGLLGDDSDESVRGRRVRNGGRQNSSVDGDHSVWTYDYDDDSSDESSETEGSDLTSEKESRIDERLFRSEREKQEYLAFKKWKARRGQQGGSVSRLYTNDDDSSQMAVESTGTASVSRHSKAKTEEREVQTCNQKNPEHQNSEDSCTQGESKEPDKYVPSSQLKKQATKPSILKKPKKERKNVHPPKNASTDEECSSSVLMQGWLKDSTASVAISDIPIARNINAQGSSRSSLANHCEVEAEDSPSHMESCRLSHEESLPVSNIGVQVAPEMSCGAQASSQNATPWINDDTVGAHQSLGQVQPLGPENKVHTDDWQQYSLYKINHRDSSVMRISGNSLMEDMKKESVLPQPGIYAQQHQQHPSAWFSSRMHRHIFPTYEVDKEETISEWHMEQDFESFRIQGKDPVACHGRTSQESEHLFEDNYHIRTEQIPKASSFQGIQQWEGREDDESMFSTTSSHNFQYIDGNAEKRNTKPGSPTMSVCSLPPRRRTNGGNRRQCSQSMYGGQSVCSEQLRQRLPCEKTPVQNRKPHHVQNDCHSVVSLDAFKKRQMPPKTRWHTTSSVV